jgi:excisionase family DNA binding protein
MGPERVLSSDDGRPPHTVEVSREQALPRLLTLPEVAAYLRVNQKTVRRWVTARRIPCVRIGTRLRFQVGDIASWVRQRKED